MKKSRRLTPVARHIDNLGHFHLLCKNHFMRLLIVVLPIVLLLSSCGKKIKDINGDEPIEVMDFIQSFQDQELPINFNSINLDKKESDSFYIKSKKVLQFIPDSLFKKSFGKATDIKFYRKGKYNVESEETYVFLVAEKKGKKVAYITCFDKKLNYSAGMELAQKSDNPLLVYEGGIDKKLTVIKIKNKKSAESKIIYNKSAYVYNTAGLFTLILTESNEPVEESSVYNPIDTLPAKNPFSGNYIQNKNNFVSIRDGGKPNKLMVFIKLVTQDGNCEGTLRGDLIQVKPKVFQYNKSDDHCIIEFNFKNNSVIVKELEACGNHRGVRCSFDGSYTKKSKKSSLR